MNKSIAFVVLLLVHTPAYSFASGLESMLENKEHAVAENRLQELDSSGECKEGEFSDACAELLDLKLYLKKDGWHGGKCDNLHKSGSIHPINCPAVITRHRVKKLEEKREKVRKKTLNPPKDGLHRSKMCEEKIEAGLPKWFGPSFDEMLRETKKRRGQWFHKYKLQDEVILDLINKWWVRPETTIIGERYGYGTYRKWEPLQGEDRKLIIRVIWDPIAGNRFNDLLKSAVRASVEKPAEKRVHPSDIRCP